MLCQADTLCGVVKMIIKHRTCHRLWSMLWLTRKSCWIVLIFIACSFLYLCMYPLIATAKQDTHFITKWENNQFNGRKHNVTVLIWSKFVTSSSWNGLYGKFGDYHCPKRCTFTFNRDLYNESQLVLFNTRELYATVDNDPLPEHRRRAGDIWMIHSSEPPWKNYLNMDKYSGMFNWTSMPRPDSDVMSFYFNIDRIDPSDWTEANKKRKHAISQFKKKTKLVAWTVSNCHSQNHREEYAKEIVDEIGVDLYGLCVTKGSKRQKYNLSEYKFYLAFENDNCSGYITEKLWSSLKDGVIPIVMGNSEAYRKYAPLGSYIDTAWFNSTRDLAQYINQVAQNESLYSTYFDWISSYKIVNSYWCDMCTAVHEWDGVHQVYTDLGGWYAHDTCYGWSISRSLGDAVEEIGRIFYKSTPFNRFWLLNRLML